MILTLNLCWKIVTYILLLASHIFLHHYSLSLLLSSYCGFFGFIFLQTSVDICHKWKIEQHYRHIYHTSNYKIWLLFLSYVCSLIYTHTHIRTNTKHTCKLKWILNVFRCCKRKVKAKDEKMATQKVTQKMIASRALSHQIVVTILQRCLETAAQFVWKRNWKECWTLKHQQPSADCDKSLLWYLLSRR